MATVQRIDDGATDRRRNHSRDPRSPASAQSGRRKGRARQHSCCCPRSAMKWPSSSARRISTTRRTKNSSPTCRRFTTPGERSISRCSLERLNASGDFELIGGAGLSGRSRPLRAACGKRRALRRDRSRKSDLRALIHSSTDILRDAYDDSGDARANAQPGRGKDLCDPRREGHRPHRNDSATSCMAAMERIDARMQNQHMQGGIETGFKDLDALTGGLHNSELVILAARPSMGKTALALNMAEYVSIELRSARAVREPRNVVDRIGRPAALLAGPGR